MTFLKEPVVHFFILGAVIFVWFSLSDASTEAVVEARITVDEPDVDRLISQFQATWQRIPTLDELDTMVDRLVREEVLVREARTLGLDRGDSIVRNRLAQKMEFLTTSLAQAAEPSDDVLKEHMNENQSTFLQPGRVSFRQIGFGEDEEGLRAAMTALKTGAEPAGFGSVSLLPNEIPLSSARSVQGVFGGNFFEQVEALPDGEWAGPIRSGYGLHLVYVMDRRSPILPDFEEIRDEVLSDWRRNLKDALSQAQFDDLVDLYEIDRPSRDQLAMRLQR